MKEKENSMVPKLRFNDFTKMWETHNLGSISDVRDGTHDSPKLLQYGKPLLTSKNLLKNGTLDFENISLISDFDYEQINKRSKVDIGDILFGMIGTIGNPVLVRRDGFAIKNVALIKEKTKLLNAFLIQYLQSDYVNSQFEILTKGNAQKFLALGVIRNIELCLPTLEEQQKIADCLSSLDDLMAAETEKLEALQAHKKGLMQKLFPSPLSVGEGSGERLPELRFAGFSGEWEEKTLNEIAENLDSKRVPITENRRIKGYYPYYGASGIIDFVNEFIFDETLLCISEDGANLVDRRYPIAFTISGKTWVNNHAHVLRFPKLFTQVLVEQYINSVSVEQYLTGMAQPKLNRAKLDSIIVPLPLSEDEQQKIADCLSSLDQQIAAQNERLEALKLHKKGLMQGLFPNLNAE